VDNNTLIILGFIVSFLTGISSAIMFINLRYLLKYRPRLNRRQREKIRALKSKGYSAIPTK
jgi:uncharacterized protein YneF (UPF0154 family)